MDFSLKDKVLRSIGYYVYKNWRLIDFKNCPVLDVRHLFSKFMVLNELFDKERQNGNK